MLLLLLLLWRYSYAACGKQIERQTHRQTERMTDRRMQHTNYAAVKCGPRFRLQHQLLHQLWLLLRRLVCGELPRLPPPQRTAPCYVTPPTQLGAGGGTTFIWSCCSMLLRLPWWEEEEGRERGRRRGRGGGIVGG